MGCSSRQGAHQLAQTFSTQGLPSSVSRVTVLPGSASKGALNALTVGMARALGPAIRVNAIAPGLVDSSWLRQGMGEERYATHLKTWNDTAALGAPITPEDVADAAWWLGAGAAKTTGEVLLLDAGFRLTKG